MAPKDYYLILGISRSETSSGIRARYRDLARRFHPDVAGPQSTGAFQEITEAYEILADPAARRRYNAELARLERRPPLERIEPRTTQRRTPRRDPMPLFAEPRAGRLVDAPVDRLFRDFIDVGLPKAERPNGLTVEVILTPEEAMRGVRVPIGLPGFEGCPHCSGTGRVWLFPCTSCGAEGTIARNRVVQVFIPPLIHARSIIEAPLDALGLDNLYLRLDVRVE